METLLLMLLIVGLFCTALVLGGIVLLSRSTTLIPELLVRTSNVEAIVTQLSADVASVASNEPTELWRTADGKYTAGSFEELLSKMANDPESPLTPEEINAIKSVFKKIMQDDPEDLFNSGDSDTDEPWKL